MMLALLAMALAAPPEPSLHVSPSTVTLKGPRDVRQLVVTEPFGEGRVVDVTDTVKVVADPPGIVEIGESLFVRGIKDGTTKLTISTNGKTISVPVTVTNAKGTTPPSFRHDLVAVMNVGGCNMGACHGTPSGKNGFKLSLRGFDPAADYLQLTRDQFSRRSDAMQIGRASCRERVWR